MAIRIDIETKGPVDTVRVSGRLVTTSIEQLTTIFAPMDSNFVLDLSELVFVDNAGADVIRGLRGKGVDIRGASNFIKLLIDG